MKYVVIPVDGSVPVPLDGTPVGNPVTHILPADGSARHAVLGTLVTPANKATYVGRHPWLDIYVIAPTGATAGAPGSFTPVYSTPPLDLAAVQGATLTKSPATNWAAGQYVVLGNGTNAYWNGTAWVAGIHP